MRCDICAPITISSLREVNYRHHSSFQALVATADQGCDFCSLLKVAFETGNNTEEHVRKILDGSDVRKHPVTLNVDSNDISNEKSPLEDKEEFRIYASLGNWLEPIPLCSPAGDTSFEHTLLPDVRVDHDHPAAIEVLSGWINRCNGSHGISCQVESQPQLPTRVIDVGSNDGSVPARVVETNGLKDRYTILSYCWGPDPQLKSTADLMDDHRRELKLQLLSQTVQDAITLTRKLRFRYLWVDALCIVQAGPGESVTADFLREAPKMKQYYGNASLTIMAEAAARCQDGFLKRQSGFSDFVPLVYDRPSRSKDSSSSPPKPLGTVFAYNRPFKDVKSWMVPLGSRAWTLQENFLSRRKLIFGLPYARYECESAIFMESGEGYSNVVEDPTTGLGGPKTLDQIHGNADGIWRRAQALIKWYGQVTGYCGRQITNPDDIFAAMEGLVGSFGDLIESRYLWGIWECDMIRGLMWYRWYNLYDGRPEYQIVPARKCSVPQPSWSWTYLDCPKSMGSRIRTKKSSESLFAQDNVCAELLNLEDIECSREPIRRPGASDRAKVLRVRGKLLQMRRSTQRHVIPYTLAGSEHFLNRVATHLCLPDRPDSHGTSSDEEYVPADEPPMATAILDNGTFDDVHRVWCLPLIKYGGLILIKDREHSFRRAGIFVTVDQGMLEKVPLSTVDII